MNWEAAPYVIALLVSVAISLFFTLFALRHRNVVSAIPFALITLAVIVWSLGYSLELLIIPLAGKIFWAQFQYLSIASISLLWLIFVLSYTDQERWLTRRNLIALSVLPMITVLLSWTNGLHGLIWSTVSLDFSHGFSTLVLSYGTWFWVHVAYSYVCLGLGSVLLLWNVARASHMARSQIMTIIIGVLLPWISNALTVLDLKPIPFLDLTPFAFSLSGVAFGWNIFRFRLFSIVPIARDKIIENLNEIIIVLNMTPLQQLHFKKRDS